MNRWALLTLFFVPQLALGFSGLATNMGGCPDGTAIGDVDGDGRLELALQSRNSSYSTVGSTTLGIGSLALIDSTGAVRWEIQTNAELAGYPAMADFDGDGKDEIVFCETNPGGECYMIDEDGSTVWSAGYYYFPGMTTSGPAAADVNGDGRQDAIVTTYGGLVLALDGLTGAELWRYDTYAQWGEQLFGFPAVGDIDGDGDLDVVVGGYENGDLYAIDGSDGSLLWRAGDMRTTWENVFYANGPLLVDLDGDKTTLEVVVAMSGANEGSPPAVAAFDPLTGANLWRQPLPNSFLSFMSPVAADVDGDFSLDILIQGGDGILRELNHLDGSVQRTFDLGEAAWVAPSFVDTNEDGVVEILATGENSLTLIDGLTFAEIDRYTDIDGGLMPSPVVADLDRNGFVDFFTASWWGEKLLRFELNVRSLNRWTNIGGSSTHNGRHSLAPVSENVAVAMVGLLDLLSGLDADPDVPIDDNILEKVEDAAEASLDGELKLAVNSLKVALVKLQNDGGYDTAPLEEVVAELALKLTVEYINRVRAIAGPSDIDIVSAEVYLDAARAAIEVEEWSAAVEESRKASNQIDKAVHYVGNFCPSEGEQLAEPYLRHQCEIMAVHDAVRDLRDSSGDASLDQVLLQLEQGVVELSSMAVEDALAVFETAETNLINSPSGTPALEAQLADAIAAVRLQFEDDAATANP